MRTCNKFGLQKHLSGWIAVLVVFAMPALVMSHPMANSLILLNVQSDGIEVELELPLNGLERAFGGAITKGNESQIREYIKDHIQLFSQDDRPWLMDIRRIGLRTAPPNSMEPYRHLVIVRLWTQPPAGADIHDFILKYDIIMHHLLTHSALVKVQQSWENGIYADNPINAGVISADLVNRTIPPLNIHLGDGGWWKGFIGMVGLGMHHIAEGTDHLLFLLVLLLAAPLLVKTGRWAGYGGIHYSLVNLLKIVTAFTLGHSITLLIGALDLLQTSTQLVETFIAFSILVSAMHAVRPIFPRREIYVAAGFGLVHGLAFAEILNELDLGAGHMALSLLGFNIGIEIMQLVIVALIMPWLIMLSQTSIYNIIRIGGALFSGVAAVAWMAERIMEVPNPVTVQLESLVQYAPWLIIILMLLAGISHVKPLRFQTDA